MSFYRATLESIDAVMGALAINKNDNVLAVCSSGDVAFAALESAKSVTAIDIEPEQLAYAARRAESLRHRKYGQFLNPKDDRNENDWEQKRNSYFRQKGRRPRIASNINNLTLVEGCVFSTKQGQEFSKVYLSNAWGNRTAFSRLLSTVQEGGLVYYSAYDELVGVYRIPKELHLDSNLTAFARQKDHAWMPIVYRKRQRKAA